MEKKRRFPEEWRDKGIIAFTFGILFSLLVSIVPTYQIIQLFHGTTNIWLGNFLSFLAVITFEWGAVISKTMTIWMPGWKDDLQNFMYTVLVLTFAANAIAGWDALQNAKPVVGSVYWHIQQNWWFAIPATLVYAAIFPVFQGVFSSGFVKRWNEIGTKRNELNEAKSAIEQLRNELERHGMALEEALRIKNVMEQQRDEALAQFRNAEHSFQIGGRSFSVAQLAEVLDSHLMKKFGARIPKTTLYNLLTNGEE